MEESNTGVIVEKKSEKRMCPDCCRMQEHTIYTIERENGRYVMTTTEEVCDVCNGRRIVANQGRGNYKLR